ncbi:MAG: ABC transporter permease [Steroidobacteraceae bacterium]
MGTRNSQLLTLVFIEAAIPCLLGALLGSVLGNLLERGVPKLFGHGPAHLLSIPAPRQSVLCWGVGFALVLAFGGSLLPMLRMRYQSVNDAMAGR